MKAYKVVYSPVALSDFEAAWDEIWNVSCDFDICDNYIKGIKDALRSISKHPKTGEQLFFDNIFTGIYYVNYKKYSAFYRIRDGYIEVGRVLYNRGDYLENILSFK